MSPVDKVGGGVLQGWPRVEQPEQGLNQIGKNLVFKNENKFLKVFKSCLCFNLQNTNAGHKITTQAKIRPRERHKSQFISEYHLYYISYKSEKTLKKSKIRTFNLSF